RRIRRAVGAARPRSRSSPPKGSEEPLEEPLAVRVDPLERRLDRADRRDRTCSFGDLVDLEAVADAPVESDSSVVGVDLEGPALATDLPAAQPAVSRARLDRQVVCEGAGD